MKKYEGVATGNEEAVQELHGSGLGYRKVEALQIASP